MLPNAEYVAALGPDYGMRQVTLWRADGAFTADECDLLAAFVAARYDWVRS